MCWYRGKLKDFSELLGQTIVEIIGGEIGDREITFKTKDKTYLMYHEQDCCEHVSLEDVDGDIDCLIGSPITLAEEVSHEGDENDWGTSTWTFYKLATVKGYVTFRWLGESNGYYSESVEFVEITT